MNMIRLKDQDQFNGSNKVAELEAVIGETFPDNFSSTNRSRLMYIREDGMCAVEEVASEYARNKVIPKAAITLRPDYIVWNGFFF